MEETFKIAKDFNIAAIEWRCANGSGDLVKELGKYLSTPANVELMKGSGLTYTSLNINFKLVSQKEEDWQMLLEAARLAALIGVKWLRVFVGPNHGEGIAPDTPERVKKTLARWHAWKKESGSPVELAIETQGEFASSTNLSQLFDAIGEHVRVIWDTHHTIALFEESPAETWARIGKDVVHVHVKDSVTISDGEHPFTYCMPGAGRIPGAEIAATLERNNFAGIVSLEWERFVMLELPTLREALEALYTAGWRRKEMA
jgi:sugar phosphate isomerase/epimerase